jgi:hypothetical protein
MGDGTICEDWIRIYGMGWKAWVKFDPQRANCRFDMIDHVTIWYYKLTSIYKDAAARKWCYMHNKFSIFSWLTWNFVGLICIWRSNKRSCSGKWEEAHAHHKLFKEKLGCQFNYYCQILNNWVQWMSRNLASWISTYLHVRANQISSRSMHIHTTWCQICASWYISSQPELLYPAISLPINFGRRRSKINITWGRLIP